MASETPIVKLLADGGIECAKGLELAECGYKPGSKVCGKCGAKAVTQTEEAVPADAAPEVAEEKSEWVSASDEKVAKMAHEETEMAEEEMPMPNPKKKKKPVMPAVAEEDEEDEEDMPEDLDDEEEKMYGEIEKMMEQRKKARAKRMETMGVKSADYDDLAFVCAIERRVYAGGSEICASCPGGCEQQDTMPSLLEIEGMAESMFAGKVLDSGYADEVDVFVVDVQRKDGKPVEAYFDGTSGECMGWHLLNEDLIGEVATVPGQKVISFSEASAIATKSIDGEVVSVDAREITIRYDHNDDDDLVSFTGDTKSYSLIKFRRTNQNSCINLRPLVRKGDKVKKGQVISEGYATQGGELALGRNLQVAYMPWQGYNFEDAIVISEKVVKDDWFTTIYMSCSTFSVAMWQGG